MSRLLTFDRRPTGKRYNVEVASPVFSGVLGFAPKRLGAPLRQAVRRQPAIAFLTRNSAIAF